VYSDNSLGSELCHSCVVVTAVTGISHHFVYGCLMSCVSCCSCLGCIVVVVLYYGCTVAILCVLIVLCAYCCLYFRCRTADWKSVFGRSCDRPPRHRFPCVYKRRLRWFPRFQDASTCFSCSPPDLKVNLFVTNFIYLYTCKITTVTGREPNCS
jgi:hypothetical protein